MQLFYLAMSYVNGRVEHSQTCLPLIHSLCIGKWTGAFQLFGVIGSILFIY